MNGIENIVAQERSDRNGEISTDSNSELESSKHSSASLEYSQEIDACEYLELLEFVKRIPKGASPNAKDLSADLPKKIGPFDIHARIGSGGTADIYRASREVGSVNRRFALKVLHHHRTDLAGRLARETQALFRLNHPNIVPLEECFQDAGDSVLVMRLIDGHSLDTLVDVASDSARAKVERRPETDQEVLARLLKHPHRIAELGADVASALSHAHKKGIIHRDIKPANLMLDLSGNVWVTDFGLAKLQDDQTCLSSAGDMIGTPRYMSPEQFRGRVDERSDVYSLGVTLWELATGQRAWERHEGCDVRDYSAVSLVEARSVCPTIPKNLSGIIAKCCQFAPADRFQSAEDLCLALRRAAVRRTIPQVPRSVVLFTVLLATAILAASNFLAVASN